MYGRQGIVAMHAAKLVPFGFGVSDQQFNEGSHRFLWLPIASTRDSMLSA